MKVLIIEDDAIIAQIYRSRLDKEGFQVEVAPDGQTGFYRIHETRPDAILLDLMLPKMDGMQILKKIRAQKQFQQVPVLVFTNSYLPDMVQEAMRSGATQVFSKAALTPRQVVEILNQALFPKAVSDEESTVAIAPEVDPSRPPGPPGEPAAAGAPSLTAHSLVPSPMPASVTHPAAPLPPGASPAFGTPATVPETLGTTPAASRGGIPFPQMRAAELISALKRVPDPVRPTPSRVVPTISDDRGDSDDGIQNELLRTFLASTPEALSALRRSLHEFMKGGDDVVRLGRLSEFYRKVHALTGNAAIAALQNIAQMGAAMGALVKELNDKPKSITPSSIRTLARGMDFLVVLFEKGRGPSLIEDPPINILVVDDEIISRRAVTFALDKVDFKSEALEDPMVALRFLSEKTYDLVILDVDMPGMNGFDLCKKLRAMPANRTTPVVFVTGMTDFQSRALSSLSGGNDLITKPFLFVELTVKVLTLVMNHRLEKRDVGAGT